MIASDGRRVARLAVTHAGLFSGEMKGAEGKENTAQVATPKKGLIQNEIYSKVWKNLMTTVSFEKPSPHNHQVYFHSG